MKIAMVVERFPPDIGGSGVRFCEIAKRLSRKHTVEVFTVGVPSVNDPRPYRIHRFDSSKMLIPKSHGLDRVAGLTLSTFFQFPFREYDVVDVDIWPILPFLSVRIAKPRTPAIISWNVVWPFSLTKTISKASTLMTCVCSRLSTHGITVSNFAKTMLVKHLRVDPERISVIPNGRDDVFCRARLDPNRGRIIFVGRLEPQKRLDLILEAFKIFKKSRRDAELHIVGSGSLKPELTRLTRNVEGFYLHEPVSADGRKELVLLLRKSWVFVSASEFETYGLSIAEALSVGLPVVLTRAPYNAAINEIAKHGYNSLIVEHNNPVAMAKAFEELYESPEYWAKVSHNARESVPFYSWDEVANQVEAVYKKVLNSQL